MNDLLLLKRQHVFDHKDQEHQSILLLDAYVN